MRCRGYRRGRVSGRSRRRRGGLRCCRWNGRGFRSQYRHGSGLFGHVGKKALEVYGPAVRIERVKREEKLPCYYICPSVDRKIVDKLETLKSVLGRNAEIAVLLVIVVSESVKPLLQGGDVLAHIAVLQNIFLCGIGVQKVKQRPVRLAGLDHIVSALKQLYGVRNRKVIIIARLVGGHVIQRHKTCLDIADLRVGIPDPEHAVFIGDGFAAFSGGAAGYVDISRLFVLVNRDAAITPFTRIKGQEYKRNR